LAAEFLVLAFQTEHPFKHNVPERRKQQAQKKKKKKGKPPICHLKFSQPVI